MDGNATESTHTDKDQRSIITTAKPQSEPIIDQKEKLSLRLAETKASAHSRAQAAIQLFNLHFSEEESQKPIARLTPKDSQKQLEELAKEESLSPTEFISKSKRALQTSTQLKNQAEADQMELAEQISARQSDVRWKIDQRVRELEEVKGIKKIPAMLEKRQLEGRKVAAQRQINQLEPQLEAKRQLIKQMSEQEEPVLLKQQQKEEEMILSEIGQEIRVIHDEYKQLLQEVLQDGSVTNGIRETYIQQIIGPAVDRILNERELPGASKDTFYATLQTCIDHREEPKEQRLVYERELENLFTYEAGFFDVKELCKPLINGGDTEIVSQVVANMAAQDIAPIKAVIYPHLRSYRSTYNFEHLFDNKTDGSHLSNQDDNLLGRQIFLATSETDRSTPNMDLWQVIKSTKAANEIFGGDLRQQDQEYYTTIMDRALSDYNGRLIDELYYYPTPDAIRNLVILAAADYREYRTVHANWVLCNLQERADWKNCLDNAESVYPQLKAARPVLESWKYREYHNQPDIQRAAGDLASYIYEGAPVDPRLTELATVALPNHSMLDILTGRNVIQASEATTIKEAERLFEKLYQEFRQKDFSGTYIESYYFKNKLRRNLFALLSSKPGETNGQQLESIKMFDTLSRFILNNQQDHQALRYLSSESVIDKLQDHSLKSEDITIFLEAYKTMPALASNWELLKEFCKQFTDKQTIQFFSDLGTAYADLENQLVPIAKLVGSSELSRERALELPSKAGDILSGDLYSLTTEYPKLYLATDQDCEFFRKILASYQHNSDGVQEITNSLASNNISRELALAFPQYATALMDSKMRETRLFIFQHGNVLLKDVSDIRFMNSLVGEFGTKSDQLIRGYQECLAADVITTADRDLVVEFARQFRVISPTIIQGFKEAKQAGHEKIYIAQLQALAERMTGSGKITDEERKSPYYKDLLRHVYSNNSGKWSSFESNESCNDRSSDLAGFKIEPRYDVDLLSQSEIRVKAGETLDTAVKEDVQKPILEVAARMNALGHDKEKIQTALLENVDNTLQEILKKGGLEGIDLKSVTTLDEKLFLILTDSMYGSRSVDSNAIKDLIITYEFATFEDISDYIAGTSDRVGRANNQDYALLCEVGTFYSDRIKEVNRRLIQTAWNNPAIAAIMPEYFRKLSQDTTMTQRKDMINRLQINRLGASESFLNQASRMLEKRNGRKYTPEEVKALIQRYESFTEGLTEKASTSLKPETKAFYGQLRSQRERTFEALKAITGQEVDPKQAHLGEINLQQVLDTETSIKEGKYNEEQFASYTVQRFIDLFEDERTKIDRELSKFESLSGKQREVLYGYITKSKESANARMVGGVCVAGDNPGNYPNNNMWDMPNYLQMVFQEPDTLQCQGLVLLHHFDEGGKKILTASFNPSSTYLYSVDESALFTGISKSLEQFATENGFDMVTVPQNKTIRTNRTGGEFEKAMDTKVSQIGKAFKFNATQQFSYHPDYKIQEMDIIWEKPTA